MSFDKESKREIYKVSGFIAGMLLFAQLAGPLLRPLIFGMDGGERATKDGNTEIVKQMMQVMTEQTKIQATEATLLGDLKQLISEHKLLTSENLELNKEQIRLLKVVEDDMKEAKKMGEALHDQKLREDISKRRDGQN